MVAGVTTLVAALALGVAYGRRPALEAEPLRFSINPPEKAKFFDLPTISPDGRTLAFVAEVDGKTQLWVRPLSVLIAQPLVEVRDRGTSPFWSPDGQFIAYFEVGKLKKIELAGAPPKPCAMRQVAWVVRGIVMESFCSGIEKLALNVSPRTEEPSPLSPT
jgi:hypothetical protein